MRRTPWSPHVDYRPGWRYLTLALDDDSELADRHLDVFERIIAETLGNHRYRLYHAECWLVVGVAPPEATAGVARLNDVLARELGAYDDPRDERGGSN